MSERIILQEGQVTVETDEGQRFSCPEGQISELVLEGDRPPLGGMLLPDGVKLTEWRSPYLLVVHQYPPQLREVRWIAPDSRADYGPATKYRTITLSVPYAITFALFFRQGDHLVLGSDNELFFSNQPLKSENDKVLGYPALLNISRVEAPGRDKAWVCTQYLRHRPETDWTGQLDNLLHHMWSGGFNRSSEHHEGASWYTLSRGVHPALHPVDAWAKASRKDSRFALSVPWKPVPFTLRELVDGFFEKAPMSIGPRRRRRPRRARGLFRSILQHALRSAKKSPVVERA